MPTDTGHGLGALMTAAESLDLSNPPTGDDLAAAARTIARHATGKDDLAELLAQLELPCGEDDLVALLPLLPAPAPDAPFPARHPLENGEITMSVDAHLAVALSMYRNGGYTLDEIHEATGMDPAELAAHLAPADHTDQGPTPALIDVPVTAKPQPAMAPTLVAGGSLTREQEDLLAGEQHTSRTIQALAARTRTGLADLAQRRGSELAAVQAGAEVEQLKEQLAAAEARLRQAKTGRIPTPAVQAIAAPTPLRPALSSAGLPREELAEIRAWARANGHEVADRGLIPRPVMEAWTNRDRQLAQAG